MIEYRCEIETTTARKPMDCVVVMTGTAGSVEWTRVAPLSVVERGAASYFTESAAGIAERIEAEAARNRIGLTQ